MIKNAPAPKKVAAPIASDRLPSTFSSLSQDLPAGLVVFLVALPLCLGISLASGAPLLSGVIAGIVGGVVVSWLSGSALSVSGPAAGLTAIIVAGIATLGSFEAMLSATVLAGLLQVGLGLARAGIIGLYFPTSVIRGMLAAIGLILILKQIPHFLGVDSDYFEDLTFTQLDGRNTFSEISNAIQNIQPGPAMVGVMALGLLLFWDKVLSKRVKVARLVPGALVVVVAAILLNEVFQGLAPGLAVGTEHLVSLPPINSLQDAAGLITTPDWTAFSRPETYTVAFTIAIVASLETLLSVEAVDKLDPHKRSTPTNREMMAQGAGNMLSGLLGGLPMTAVIVRSSANINAGGQTRMSAFFHGILLLVSLLFLAPLLNRIPLSALAAILLVIGYKLTNPDLYRTQWKLGWQQFLPFIITIVAILLTDLLRGVVLGLVVGVFYILKANYDSAYFRSGLDQASGGPIVLRLSEQVSFLNKASIMRALDELPHNARVVIDGSDSVFIDYDVLEAIENFRQGAPERGIELELRNIPQVKVIGH
ncbi:SulP family inorganic anion transporter [Hymenobacter lapidiphilus]|uniref:SulP family inorganic anion transporter n=1 Tax=Hymenobacter sp. CCM 8763 TaxID=2303334 RepID=UPI000E3554D0|nr:SulP family inorganic anion transporter [Hymenobacter sp. CCM 8763]RFP65991.1 SulP family inorganic anion transporter [Hymenobacter sp. CCM 8763]